MIPRGCGCWTDRVDMDSSLSSAGQTAVDRQHAILQSTDGIQKGKSQSVYHNHTWLSPWWSSQFCSPSSSTYQWSGKKRGNTQGPYSERVPHPPPQICLLPRGPKVSLGMQKHRTGSPSRTDMRLFSSESWIVLEGLGWFRELPPKGDLEDG